MPGLQRTHPDQVFFCIGPLSRMRMTPAKLFPTPNSLLLRCADGARRRRSLRRPPCVVYTGLHVPVLVAARHLRLFPCGTAAPDPADCFLLSRWPDIRHANGEDTRRHAARNRTSRSSNQLVVWMPAQYFECYTQAGGAANHGLCVFGHGGVLKFRAGQPIAGKVDLH